MNTLFNAYPHLPVLPYKRTSIPMPLLVVYAKTMIEDYLKEVVRTSYCIFRNESGNGVDGVNNNYSGMQADEAIWQGLDMRNVTGTCIKMDNNGDRRRFLCFNSLGYEACFKFLCYKVDQRGIYIGSDKVVTPDDLAKAYELHWVENPPENTPDARENFKYLYSSSLKQIA